MSLQSIAGGVLRPVRKVVDPVRQGLRPVADVVGLVPRVIGASAGRALGTINGVVGGVLDLGRRHRRVWVGGGRAHIALRGADRPDAQAVWRKIGAELQSLDGVHLVEVNAMLARLIVAFDDGAVSADDLVDVIDSAEEALDVAGGNFAGVPHHPADREPLQRNLVALGADVVGLGFSGFGQLARVTPMPVEVASLVSVVDTSPRLRGFVEGQLGPAGDLGLALLNAAAQGLSHGPLGLVVDIGHRAGLVSEVRARNKTWDQREAELVGHGFVGSADTDPRPAGLPAGPIERYVDRSSLTSLAAMGVGAVALRSPRRAADLAVAGLPKAARLGREAFCAQLGRGLADRGTVIMDPVVLRRLDRIDTIVLDGSILTTGAQTLGDVLSLSDRSKAQIRSHAQALFDPSNAQAVRESDGWSIGPFDQFGSRISGAATAALRELQPGSQAVLALRYQGELVGAVAVVAELDGLAEPLISSARTSGLTLVVADGGGSVATQVGADQAVADGDELAASIRSLQNEGGVVALVARGPTRALRAADCGIGLLLSPGSPPWGADLIVGPGLGSAIVIVGACRSARRVSGMSTQLATAGSLVGGAMALTAPPLLAGRRALLPVNGAALASIANGAWSGLAIARLVTPVATSAVHWHALDIDEVLERLQTSREGLSPREAARRRHDPAIDPDPALSPTSFLRALGEELANPLTPLLGAGAALSAAVGSIVDAALVGGVTGLNAMVGAAQRMQTERSLARLVETSSGWVTVTRGGSQREVPVDEVVVGDIVHLGAGEVVPADCRLVDADALELDESALTGESVPVTKSAGRCPASAISEQHCMLFADTTVAAGTATAVAVAIGRATEAGRALAGATEPPPSGVETRLARLTGVTVPVTLASGVLTTVLGLVRGRTLRTAVQAGVSLTVAAVPEGLPLLATVAQSASAQRLSKKNALVRNPRTIEALGRAELLCFDKTGTLTEGRLSLQRVSDGSRERDLDHLGDRHRAVLAAALRATPAPDTDEPLPHATDRAVADGATRAGIARDEGAPTWTEIDELPFESKRSFHAVVGETSDGHRIAVKGAPEVVLPRCRSWVDGRDDRMLDTGDRRQLDAAVDGLARQGFRVLAVAERGAVPSRDVNDDEVEDLQLLGFLALADPVRPLAAAAIEDLRRAGIDVAMITGDHASTAEAIAADLGILNGGQVITGPELDELDDDELTTTLNSAAVFARVTPAHKVRIVEGFQRNGRVVAMTGDGANDAAAIRLAHVGIAIGRRSGMAAREAADLVVTDDRVETIIDAIIEGRAMWASVRDALAILIGGNLGEVAFTLVGSALTGDAPLNTRQLLLVNLLTDLVPAMAIALRPPSRTSPEQLAHEGPEASLGDALARQIALRAVTTTLGASGAWVVARSTGRPKRARTVGLVALVGTQLGQTVVAGGNSPVVVVSSAASAAALAAIVQTPVVSQFFGCTPLGPLAWATGIGAASSATVGSIVVPWLTGQGQRILSRRRLGSLPAAQHQEARVLEFPAVPIAAPGP